MLSCRTGPLRAERSLRDVYTGRGKVNVTGLAWLGRTGFYLRR
jgi:hypothetical protein